MSFKNSWLKPSYIKFKNLKSLFREMVTEDVDEESYLPKRVKMISLGDSGAGKSAIIKVRVCVIADLSVILKL